MLRRPIQRGHTWEYKAGLAERGWEDVMEIIRMFTWPNEYPTHAASLSSYRRLVNEITHAEYPAAHYMLSLY